jgi:uncharacterized protein (DUF2147 family)
MAAMRRAIAIAALGTLTAAQAPADPLEGYWRNPSGTAIIAIAPCGKSLCGTVAWTSARGQREVSATTAHIVGTRVLSDVKRSDGHWSGNLFIPDDNIHVSAKLQLVGSRELKLTGCALIGLFCRSQLWTRVEPPLPTGG